MSESKTNVSVFDWGSFLPALTLIFITLKLTGTIGWSWWWVLAPLWIPILIGGVIVIGFIGFGLAAIIIADLATKQKLAKRKKVFREKVAELRDKE